MSYRLPDFIKRVVGDSVAATHAAAVLTYAAAAGGQSHALTSLTVTFSATPAAVALLKVEDGSGNIIWQVDILVAAPTPITFVPPLAGSPNTAMIVTLGDGGAAILGHLNAGHMLVEQ